MSWNGTTWSSGTPAVPPTSPRLLCRAQAGVGVDAVLAVRVGDRRVVDLELQVRRAARRVARAAHVADVLATFDPRARRDARRVGLGRWTASVNPVIHSTVPPTAAKILRPSGAIDVGRHVHPPATARGRRTSRRTSSTRRPGTSDRPPAGIHQCSGRCDRQQQQGEHGEREAGAVAQVRTSVVDSVGCVHRFRRLSRPGPRPTDREEHVHGRRGVSHFV